MATDKKRSPSKASFVSDYNTIVRNPQYSAPSIHHEWVKKGDLFEKFTMFNKNYKTVPTLKSVGSNAKI